MAATLVYDIPNSTVRALADEAADVSDAYVTLLVHAGIAAADVICCQRLGEHALGDSHAEAQKRLPGHEDPEHPMPCSELMIPSKNIEYPVPS